MDFPQTFLSVSRRAPKPDVEILEELGVTPGLVTTVPVAAAEREARIDAVGQS
jgi:hypothetical protein